MAIATIFSSSTSSWCAERAQERRRLGALLGRSSRASRTRRSCPCPAGPGVLGMLRTTWSWPRMPIEGRGRRAGEDAQDELAATQVRADLAPDPAEHLRLDPEQDDVGALDGLDVASDRPDRRTRARGARAAPGGGGWRRPGRLDELARGACPRSSPRPSRRSRRSRSWTCAKGDIAPEYSRGLSRPMARRSARRARRPT